MPQTITGTARLARKQSEQHNKKHFQTTRMESLPISKVRPNSDNPRYIKDEKFKKLVQSLRDFPEMANVRPIVVNTEMVVLGGNMRLKAMQEAGWSEVPVQVVDWSEEKQREFIIKDNVGFGEWDWDELANTWGAEELKDWGLDLPVILDNSDDDLKDLSSTIDNLYRIEIVCKDEEHQENTYNKLIEQGYECRLLTL
jgi:ParB-like chromosome segregation protein Spo0J